MINQRYFARHVRRTACLMRGDHRLLQLAVILCLTLSGLYAGNSALAQEESEAAGAAGVANPGEITVQFNFKNAAYAEVIDFFSRATGVPVIREVDPPGGTLTYFAPEPYSLSDGLRILNIILQTKGVTLRRDGEFLYLGKFDKTNIGTTVVQGKIPGDVTDDQLVTILIPLENITAKEVSERLQSLVGSYGSITPLPQQNRILLTETAGQARRLQALISELDTGGDYEDQVRIFPLQYAEAKSLLDTLKVLMSERVVKYVINQQGQQVKLEEDDLAGLRIQSDDRTNTIIAKGPIARLDTLEQMIQMLDKPGQGDFSGREMTTIALREMNADDAAKLLNDLFMDVDKKTRPTVLPLDEVNKVTVIGSTLAITQALALVEEVDGGGEAADGSLDDSRSTAVISLDQSEPDTVQNALRALMTPRQQRLVRILTAPDDKSLILAGPTGDVQAVRQLIETIDLPVAEKPREVRMIEINHADQAASIIDRTNELYAKQGDPDDPDRAVEIDRDPESNLVTLIGTREALESWQRLLNTVESTVKIERETRQIKLAHATPSAITRPLTNLIRQLLQPTDGSNFEPPSVTPVDELDSLLVTFMPGQWPTIESLIQTLDEEQPRDLQFQVVRVTNQDPRGLSSRALELYNDQTSEEDQSVFGPIDVEIDNETGSLLLRGTPRAISTYTNILNQLRQLTPPARTTRFVEVRQARIEDVLPTLQELLDKADPIDPARSVPPPTFTVVADTNGMLVTAEAAQHRMIDDLLARLDVSEPTELAPLRLLQLRAADVNSIANMLRTQYDQRPAEERREKPVNIQADPATNTLIVSAHDSIFEEIREFVSRLNEDSANEAERVTEIFPLKNAQASELSRALNMLYPEPPIPRDRRGQPMPWLQQPREVVISNDNGTNSIIVDAPAERIPAFKALVEKLDRIELPPQAEIRTYPIRNADIKTIEHTLTGLASSGALSAPSEGGKPAVKVSVTAEPVSSTLIVTGDETTFAKVEQLLTQLEAVPVERELRIIPIANADPEAIREQSLALYDQQIEDIPDAQPVDVQIDRASNSLMVVAESKSMARYVSIIDKLQESIGPGQEVRLTPLEHATAADVVDFLRDLVESSKTFQSNTPGPAPMFEPIERTNSILIAAQPIQHQIIQSLIRELDVVENADLPPVRILQLESADASNLASVLTSVYDSRPPDIRQSKPVSIRADNATNTLLVSAHPEPFAEIQKIVEELNESRSRATTGREIRIFPLKVARAEELARTIDQMFPDPPIPTDYRGRPMYNLRQPREVVVRADPQTNSIIVDAPVERMSGFEELVRQLDSTEITADAEVRTYPIRHADLNAVRTTIQQLAQSGALLQGGQVKGGRAVPITVTAEPTSRTLIVAGPSEIFEGVDRVLTDLDAQPDRPATVMRFFTLEHARADKLVPLLQQILISRMKEEVDSTHVQVDALLEVTSESKTNSLIISAPESIMPIAEQLIKQLDSESASLADPVIRIHPLTFADADEVANTLNSTLPQMISKTTREPVEVRVIAAAGSNALVLVGAESELQQVESLIDPLDAQPGHDAVVAETFTLEFAEATPLARTIERLLNDQLELDPWTRLQLLRSGRGQSLINDQKRIRVEADERTNSLIVSGPQATLALARSLIEQLDHPIDSSKRHTAMYMPARAVPDRLVNAAQRMIAAGAAGRQAVDIFHETQSGTIVAIGPEEPVNDAIELMKNLDEQTPVLPSLDLQLLSLNYADPNLVSQTLTRMLRDRSRWPEELQEAARAGLPVAEPTASADAQLNRVLVSAPKPLMALARQVVDELDREPGESESREMRVFNLRQADAANVATTVQEMLRDATPGRRNAASAARVAAEPSTNSLVVSASPDQLEEVEQLIESIDAGVSADQVQVRAVYLKHGRAERIAPIVEQLLKGEEVDTWIRYNFLMRGRDMPDTGPDVRVASETRLNAVIVSAPTSVLDVAEEMIRQLDVDPAEAGGASMRAVRVIPLRNADAQQVATSIEDVLTDEDAATGDPAPVIRVDAPSNSLIVRATAGQFETIDRIIGDLEKASLTGARQMQMIPLDRSRMDAAETARTIKRLLEQQSGAKVEVITIDELIQRQNSEPTNKDNSKKEGAKRKERIGVGELIPARVRLLAEIGISQLAVIQDGSAEKNANSGTEADEAVDDQPEITIAVDPATNSLVVVGSPFAAQRVADLARQLQEQIPQAPGQIRYIPLDKNTDANQVANFLNNTVNQVRRQSANTFTGAVAVIGDATGNGLIVSANDVDFETIGSLLAAMNRPDSMEKITIKVYPLSTIGADRAVESINSLFGSDPRRRGRQTQRVRELLIDLDGNELAIDPSDVNVTPSPNNDALIVAAPPKMFRIIDRFLSLIDQAPATDIAGFRQFPLKFAEAEEIQRTLRDVFDGQYRAQREQTRNRGTIVRATVAADARTNTLVVSGTEEHFKDVERLLASLDVPVSDDAAALTVINLESALPSRIEQMVNEIVIGKDSGRDAHITVVADDPSQVLLVRAPDAELQTIQRIVAEVDRAEAKDLPIRSIKLTRADADRVAAALQQFFEDRARISQRPGQPRSRRRVSVVGDQRSSTIIVASNDDDFAEIQRLVSEIDSPSEAQDLKFSIITLKHAKARDLVTLVESMGWELMYDQTLGRFGGRSEDRGKLSIQADERTNSVIVSGSGENFSLIEDVIHALDVPYEKTFTRRVRVIPVKHGDTSLISRAVTEAFTANDRPWWWFDEPSPDELKVLADNRNKLLIVSGDEKDLDAVETFVASLDEASKRPEQRIEVITLANARAGEVAENLARFFRDRARSANLPDPGVTITPSQSANKLVISADEQQILTIRDLLTQLDVPAEGDDRMIRLFVLKDADAMETMQTMRQLFPPQGVPADQRIVTTADARTNALVVSAPRDKFGEVESVLTMIDAPAAGKTKLIKTYTLQNARASEAASLLTQTLSLEDPVSTRRRWGRRSADEDVSRFVFEQAKPGEEGVEIDATITPNPRTNSLIVVATRESLPVIEQLISEFDEAPAVTVRDFRIYPLKHAIADDVRSTLVSLLSQRTARGRTSTDPRSDDPPPTMSSSTRDNTLVVAATPEQHTEIEKLLEMLDVPARTARVTEFVPLEFAEAEKVAEALDVFYGRWAFEADTPSKRNVSIVPDPASNSLVISAEEVEWPAIRELINKLDAEQYDSSLRLEVIALEYADANSVADAINRAFAPDISQAQGGGGRGGGRNNGGAGGGANGEREAPRILVEDIDVVRAAAESLTNSIIVSASKRNMTKIKGIVEQLDVADFAKLPPARLIPLDEADAVDLADTLRTMYAEIGRGSGGRRSGANAPGGRKTVVILGDKASNTIIVRAEDEEFEQIQALARALEETSGTEGVTVRVLSLNAAAATRVAGAIRDTFNTTARDLDEPLAIQVDASSNSLVIASSARLFEQIEDVARELDKLGPGGGKQIYVVPLENVSPDEMKRILESLGLNRQQPDGSNLLAEPISITTLKGRRSLAILANPTDRERIIGIVASLDAVPDAAGQDVRIVELKRAEAAGVANILRDLLNPTEQHAQTSLAIAVQEQIRRLNIRRNGLDTPDLKLDLTQPIRIMPAQTANSIMIASTPSNCDSLVEIARMFDRLPITEAVTMRLFPLSNISAQQMMSIADQLFTQGQALRRQPGGRVEGEPESAVGAALVDEVSMAVDERTNTLIVAGREPAVALVEVLVDKLDNELNAKWVEPRVVPLKHADAETIASLLDEILVRGQATNRQATALQNQVSRLRVLRKTGRRNWLDRNAEAPDDNEYVDADLFVPMSRLLIQSDSQMNALIVVGTPENLDVVGELVSMLDVPEASPANSVRIYTMKNASAGRVATVIRDVFNQQVQAGIIRDEDRVIIQPDERTNSIIVTTTTRSFALLETLLDSLDSERPIDLHEIRIVRLDNASASLIAPQVQRLMDARVERMRKYAPEAADLEQVTIFADARTNALLVSAGNEAFEVIQRLAQSLDSGIAADAGNINVIPLTNANLSEVADTINNLMQRQYGDLPEAIAKRERPLVLTDTRSNSLLVAASDDDLSRIRDLIAKIEEAPLNPAVAVHVVPIAGNNAETLAPRLQRLMDERERSLGRSATPQDATSIQPDPLTNSLLVVASEENLAVIRSLIDTLREAENDVSADERVEIITLQNSKADRMLGLINELYVREANRTRGEGTVRVTADTRLNAIVVSASEMDVAEIRSLVEELETARVSDVREIEIIPLKAANAVETVSLIENVLGSGQRRGDEQSTVVRLKRPLETDVEEDSVGEESPDHRSPDTTETQITTAIREAIRLTPDLRTNSIIVSAPSESMAMIRDMIDQLDSAETGSKRVRIFELTNADAVQMAQILADLFNMRQQNNMYVLRPRTDQFGQQPPGTSETGTPDMNGMQQPGGRVVGSLANTDLITVPDERQQLSITIDARTNSLLVSGTPSYLDLVEEVILELDSKEGATREEFVYPLRNALAEDVATALETFLTQEQQRILDTLGPERAGSIIQQLEREVSVVGVSDSNTLMISASPRYMERVKNLVQELDRSPPQVLISVMLAEVTLDLSEEWGTQWDVGPLGGEDLTVRSGMGLLGAALSGLGVPNLSVSTDDVNFLIRALEQQGRLEVLSRPQILVNNNQTAEFQVGQDISLPSEVVISESGAARSTTDRESIGIILNVTPTISPDSFVRMDIMPEISSLSSETTQISEDFQAPIVDRRMVNTVVTIRDGQSVVIGGLFNIRSDLRKSKVPILGDLPVVGGMFQTHLMRREKTELLVVITPHVVASPDDAEKFTDEAIVDLTLPRHVKEQLRRGEVEADPEFMKDSHWHDDPREIQERERNKKQDDPRPDSSAIREEDSAADGG